MEDFNTWSFPYLCDIYRFNSETGEYELSETSVGCDIQYMKNNFKRFFPIVVDTFFEILNISFDINSGKEYGTIDVRDGDRISITHTGSDVGVVEDFVVKSSRFFSEGFGMSYVETMSAVNTLKLDHLTEKITRTIKNTTSDSYDLDFDEVVKKDDLEEDSIDANIVFNFSPSKSIKESSFSISEDTSILAIVDFTSPEIVANEISIDDVFTIRSKKYKVSGVYRMNLVSPIGMIGLKTLHNNLL